MSLIGNNNFKSSLNGIGQVNYISNTNAIKLWNKFIHRLTNVARDIWN